MPSCVQAPVTAGGRRRQSAEATGSCLKRGEGLGLGSRHPRKPHPDKHSQRNRVRAPIYR